MVRQYAFLIVWLLLLAAEIRKLIQSLRLTLVVDNVQKRNIDFVLLSKHDELHSFQSLATVLMIFQLPQSINP